MEPLGRRGANVLCTADVANVAVAELDPILAELLAELDPILLQGVYATPWILSVQSLTKYRANCSPVGFER